MQDRNCADRNHILKLSKFRVYIGGRGLYFCTVMTNYERIEKAIVYLKENFKEQPDLDEVAG